MTKQEKIKKIKKAIKNKTYNWEKAIEKATEKILNNPEVLLWRWQFENTHYFEKIKNS